MQAAASMQLPFLAIENPDFARDPWSHLAAARRAHPWLAKWEGGYMVHEFQAMHELSYMDDKFRPSMDSLTDAMGARGTRWGDFMDNLMLAKSGAEHARLRSSVAASFTPRNINRYRDLMRGVVANLLDEWAPKARFDFAQFAANFPITVMFGLMGASPAALPGIRTSLETQGLSASLDSSLLPAMQAAYEVLYAFVHGLIVERRATPGGRPEDVLNTLIEANRNGTLDEDELHNLLIFLFAAGFDTSKNMLTLIMYTMIQHPHIWRRCAEDRPYCDKVVEEMLRFNSVSSLYRTATQDVIYRDVLFPQGSLLFFPLSTVGRDPDAFQQADDFNPERESMNNRHMAFGRGKHMCLGQHLARAQIQEGVHLIAQRITNPRIAGELTWRRFPGVWGLQSLPIEFDPAPRRA